MKIQVAVDLDPFQTKQSFEETNMRSSHTANPVSTERSVLPVGRSKKFIKDLNKLKPVILASMVNIEILQVSKLEGSNSNAKERTSNNLAQLDAPDQRSTCMSTGPSRLSNRSMRRIDAIDGDNDLLDTMIADRLEE